MKDPCPNCTGACFQRRNRIILEVITFDEVWLDFYFDYDCVLKDLFLAGSRDGSISWCTALVLSKIWIDCHDIHGPQRMSSIHFGDPLNFPLVPPWGSYSWVLVKCWTTSGWIVVSFGTFLLPFSPLFIWHHHQVKISQTDLVCDQIPA